MARSKKLAEVIVAGNKCVATKQSDGVLWESHILAGVKDKRRKVAIHVGSFPTAADALDAAVIGRIQAKIEIKPSSQDVGVPLERVDIWDKEVRLSLYDLPEEDVKKEDFRMIQPLLSEDALVVPGFWARVAAFFKKAFSFLVLWK